MWKQLLRLQMYFFKSENSGIRNKNLMHNSMKAIYATMKNILSKRNISN